MHLTKSNLDTSDRILFLVAMRNDRSNTGFSGYNILSIYALPVDASSF
jgi:hypothetical protein